MSRYYDEPTVDDTEAIWNIDDRDTLQVEPDELDKAYAAGWNATMAYLRDPRRQECEASLDDLPF